MIKTGLEDLRQRLGRREGQNAWSTAAKLLQYFWGQSLERCWRSVR
jgi:hypothetical protein